LSVASPIDVFVYDSTNGRGIAGAIVSWTYEVGDGTYPSEVTDGVGYVRIGWPWNNNNVLVTAEAKGYGSNTVMVWHTGLETCTIYLDPSSVLTYNVDLWAVDNQNRRLESVKFIIDGVTRETGPDGLVRFNLASGPHTVVVEGPGYWVGGIGLPVEVNFLLITGQITVSKDDRWYASVQQGIIMEGSPPATEPPNMWDWLLKWGPYLVVGTVVVGVAGYFMTSVSRVVRAVKPNNRERKQYE